MRGWHEAELRRKEATWLALRSCYVTQGPRLGDTPDKECTRALRELCSPASRPRQPIRGLRDACWFRRGRFVWTGQPALLSSSEPAVLLRGIRTTPVGSLRRARFVSVGPASQLPPRLARPARPPPQRCPACRLPPAPGASGTIGAAAVRRRMWKKIHGHD